MRKILVISIALSGALLGVFIFNLLLFSTVPSYHDALEEAVLGESTIPTIIVDKKNEPGGRGSGTIFAEEPTEQEAAIEDEPVALTPTAFTDYPSDTKQNETEEVENIEPKKEIIDKTYHEDCGTGEGYWVITYSDGSTEVE